MPSMKGRIIIGGFQKISLVVDDHPTKKCKG